MSWHRAGVLLLGAQSCLPVPGVPAVGGIGSILLSMARMGWKLCHVFRLYTVVGMLVQKYKLKLVADSPGTGSSKDGELSIRLQAYLQEGVFPNYRTLITDAQPVVQAAPSVAPTTQPTAPASTPLPTTSAMALGQPMNPRLLMREHPQPTGQTANQPTQDQVAAMFLPPPPIVDPVQQQLIQQTPPRQRLQPIQQTPVRQQIVQPIQHPGSANVSAGFAAPGGRSAQQFVNQVIPEHLVHHAQPDGTLVPQMVPEHLVRNVQPNLHNYQGGNLSYQYQLPSPQAQYQPGGSAQQQFAPQFGQFEPMQQQPQGTAQHRTWADVIADVMREQFGLKPKETGRLYRQPYPEWFERCGEASAVDALRVRMFRLSLSGLAFTWFSSLPYGSVNSWADLEKQFHSYFYSGVHEMKLFDLTAIKQRYDEPVHEYIQRFREIRNKCFSLSLTDAQLADLAFQGMIPPIREKFSSEDFDSLSYLIQKVTLHEHRSADVRRSSKKVNHICPYMYGSDDEDDDSEIAAAEWVRSKKVISCQWVKSPGKEEKKYDKQQTRRYEENDNGFDPYWDCEFFRFCWNEGMRLPSIENCPGCSDVIESSSRPHNKGDRPRQTRLPVHQRLGPMSQDRGQEDEGIRKNQWCPSGIFTKNQKRRVQRLRSRERFQEVEEKINHRLRKPRPRQVWRVKNQVPTADDAAADEAKRLAKGKSVVTAPINMVFTLPAEFGVNQTDVDEVEDESAKLVISPEQAIFEKPEGMENRHHKPLYVNGYVNGKPMSKMMVDGGAAVNLMPYATFRKLGRNAEDLIKTNMVLKHFGGNPSETKGVLNVELTVGSKTIPTTFFVIDGKRSYSLLLGRDWIHTNCCIPSTMHQCLIQWQGHKIEVVPADSQSKMENPSYYFEGVVEGSDVYAKDTVDDLDDKQGQGFMSADDLEEIDIGPGDWPRPTFISKNLSSEFRTKLIELLKEFRDCFAWEYYEMPGLSRSIVEHRLPIKPGVRPHQQPPRRCKADMLEPVKAEIKQLYDAGFIRPCRYAEWVSCIVPVIKKNGKVRVCIDFRDLNKATPKDKYPMPVSDQLVDAASGNKILSFMDGNAGYNQIFMAEEDIHKTAFRVEVTQRSVNAIQKIKPPENKTELQEMIGKINFVRRFISNLSGRLEPFTPLLRLKADQQFTWGAEQQKALDNIKEYLSSSPVLIPPQKGIPFRLYLSAGEKSIGSVLIQELEGKERVVFYLSRRLLDAETRYSPVEKLCLCLYFSCTRLRHYLLSNECTVICKADVVRYMLSAPILKGRIGKWIFSLTEFDLRYESPKAIKGQAIADFIVEHRDDSIGSVEIAPWTLFFDGSNDTLMVYNEKCLELMKEFRLVTLKHVSREQNLEANDLAQGASGYKPMIKDVKVEIAVMSADDWRYDVHQYLSNPSQSASRRLRYKALKYTLLGDELYYRTIDGVLLKCLSADQAKVAIGEVHERICGTHQSAHKMKWLLRRTGYFWPTMQEDCFRYYKGCQDCQKFGAVQRALASAMNPIIKPWLFRGWGIDMIGMINPPSSKGHKFILVATDYFTKWVEAIPLKKVDSEDAIQFIQEHIIYRFGLPQTITTDQGSIFVSDEFVQFADSVGIKLLNSSPYYAQANGQAEASNKSGILGSGILDWPKHYGLIGWFVMDRSKFLLINLFMDMRLFYHGKLESALDEQSCKMI
uniref:Polyprotein n=1 Tax=Oryza sativa subsp. japonica TaxID=39947 RepID=Q5W683_ORYSJ|nr:putative polyprotein [Oryza sativa Japonica Group]AAV44059.1 hypothetical protein [Oryza sativa Japonica Group]